MGAFAKRWIDANEKSTNLPGLMKYWKGKSLWDSPIIVKSFRVILMK